MLGWLKRILLAIFVVGLMIFGSYMTIQHTSNVRAISEVDGAIRSTMLGKTRGMGVSAGIDKDEFAGAVIEGVVNTQKKHNRTVRVKYVFFNKDGQETENSEQIKSVQYELTIVNKDGIEQSKAVKHLAISDLGEGNTTPPEDVKTVNVNFEKGKQPNRSKTITINDLGQVVRVTVDNGNVSYTVNGKNVTVNVSGGTPIRRLVSGDYTPAHTKYVTGQSSSYYNKDGYVGTLSPYYEGNSGVEAERSKYVVNQPSSSYSDGEGYKTKPGQPLVRYVKSGEYIPEYRQEETTSQSNSTGSFPASIVKNGVTMTKSGSMTSYQTGGTYTPEQRRAEYATKVQSGRCIKTDSPNWGSCMPAPSQPSYIWYSSGGFSGYLDQSDYQYEQVNDATGHNWKRTWYYAGIVTKPAVDTRTYWYTQNYYGLKYIPAVDTRQYAYQGTVYKAGTNGTSQTSYQGYVTKPAVDTRVYENTYEYNAQVQYK